jgi:glutathione S-transferase
MRNPHEDEEYGGGGEYTEVDPPRRLAFTWEWDDEREQRSQVIEIDFVPEGGDRTTVHFTHHGLWDQETVHDHEDGWNKVLANLDRDLRKERGG